MTVDCALIQMGFSTDRDDNLTRAKGLLREAASAGARLACLPELSTNIYFCFEENDSYKELAEPIPGPSTDRIGAVAVETGMWVVFPLYERTEEHLFNAAVLIDPRGELRGKYRKNSIPQVRLPEMVGGEKYYFQPGDLGYPVFATDLGIKVGITICYERHFPESTRSLALAGADLILIPTATAAARDMWEVELRGHAIANLCWVGGVNRSGRDRGSANEAEFWGDSLFAAPSGEVVTRATDGADDQLVIASIDTELSRKLRADWGFFRDRRPELYGAIAS
jgi:N-carbamoylputrescine amidase